MAIEEVHLELRPAYLVISCRLTERAREDDMADSEAQTRIALQAGRVFTPAAPVDRHALLAGRKEQLRKVVDTVVQRGRHAIIFGERGVGKTSLASVLEDTLRAPEGEVITAHVNCDSADTFQSLWLKIFGEIELHTEVRSAGYQPNIVVETTTVADELHSPITTNKVRKVLSALAANALLVVIAACRHRDPEGARRGAAIDHQRLPQSRLQPAA